MFCRSFIFKMNFDKWLDYAGNGKSIIHHDFSLHIYNCNISYIQNINIHQHSNTTKAFIMLNRAHCNSWPRKKKTEPTVVPCLQHWYEDWHTIVLLPKWPPHNFLYIKNTRFLYQKCRITSYVWSSSKCICLHALLFASLGLS